MSHPVDQTRNAKPPDDEATNPWSSNGDASGVALVRRVIRSFGYALAGVGFTARTQINFWIHLVCLFIVVAVGLLLGLDRADWLWLTLAITAVLMAETFNTAIEQLCDAVSTDHHPGLGRAKDAAAGAVLLTAIGAVVIGLLVFGPRLYALL